MVSPRARRPQALVAGIGVDLHCGPDPLPVRQDLAPTDWKTARVELPDCLTLPPSPHEPSAA
ncbi:hypothetical protein GCM10017779_58340 [Streptomyces capillispiralis]|nr:hypothetical protein GCM10017779_58340 [Streptomyces capillispiralis]